MALSSSLKSKAYMVEKTTTLGVASGTTVLSVSGLSLLIATRTLRTLLKLHAI